MKYVLGSVTIEAIDNYVRVTVEGIGCRVTDHQFPKTMDVALIVHEMRGFWPDNAVIQACSRAAIDARNSKIEIDL
jgi:hypothetical protein